jgi:hypothetical protein
VTVAFGFVQFTLALALPEQLARHEALASQLSVPVQRGAVAMPVHMPWHSPLHIAIPGV